MYRYYVAYSHSRGNGAAAVNLDCPIAGWDVIETVKGWLADANPQLSDFVITSWQRFEDET